MVCCRTCKRSFSERKGTVLEQARLLDDKDLPFLRHLREGCGRRGTGAPTGEYRRRSTSSILGFPAVRSRKPTRGP